MANILENLYSCRRTMASPGSYLQIHKRVRKNKKAGKDNNKLACSFPTRERYANDYFPRALHRAAF